MEVSLERAVADVRLRPGNAVTMSQLRQLIKDNGFTAKEATVTVVGNLIERGGKPALEVTGTNVVMLMVPDPKAPDVYKELEARLGARQGQSVEVRGVLESRTDHPDQIAVVTITGAGG